MEFFGHSLAYGFDIALLALVVAVAKLVQIITVKLLARSTLFFKWNVNEKMMARARLPLFFLLVLLGWSSVLPLTHLSDEFSAHAIRIMKSVSVACIGWLAIALTFAFGDWMERRLVKQARDNLGIRRLTTQIRTLKRVFIALIIVLTLIGIAVSIPGLRQLGVSLFASAGVAGIVLGIAANTTLSNFIAGMQLALTQQILLGDEVVIDGEFGTIEEITSSYVVVRIWDLRRLVIPLRYFMEHSFQNWTYHDPAVLGTIYFYTDYTLDIAGFRAAAERVTKESPLWDGNIFGVQVTDSKEKTLEVRILVGAANSGNLWNLRCDIREKMILYLQLEQPDAFPLRRLQATDETELHLRRHHKHPA